ncbi:hypothetical protein J4573_27040 [Actinomadura barringtoniae]|uniref:Uncharacterized protein n=1 Tax=Actinomadura barringtoniae TaxID=1427535 RepID=A0A939PIP0_9ACTN|nr:hypothetical protein [Actinomadura barringtoniae]MBO2450783.1 hypothetical protein [Actinomadura barringtoniae]
MRGLNAARQIADAVLYEGYLLYPYRASAAKNKVRWQFGVLVPPGFTATSEPSASRTECLLEAGADAVLHLRLRFLHVQARRVDPEGLVVDGVQHRTFDEAVEAEIDADIPVMDLLAAPHTIERIVPARRWGEELGPGRIMRTRWPLRLELRVRAEPVPGPYGGIRLAVEVGNTTAWDGEDREAALRRSLVAAHVLLGLTHGRFLSLRDPPEWARQAAEACRNEHAWPVLIQDDVVLASPIILDDRPSIAPESPGDLFDGTEIDEILTLRTLALTDAEKREARGTDPRAAEIIDRVDAMPPEVLARLHGAIRSPGPRRGWDEPVQRDEPVQHDSEPVQQRTEDGVFEVDRPWWDPGADASVSPETDSVVIAGVPVARGAKLRLRPSGRSDAQDMFVAGRTATVEAVLMDVDGATHLAVTLDDDPGADIRREQGRFLYFGPEEVEPL